MTASDSQSSGEMRAIRGLLRRIRCGDNIDWDEVESTCPSFMSVHGDNARTLHSRISSGRSKWEDSISEFEPGIEDDTLLDSLGGRIPGYILLSEMGRGGQGVVFEAIQEATKRTVAIKVLWDGPQRSRRRFSRFYREIELVGRLRHPNIVGIHETGTVDGRPYFVMEFVDGVPIDDYALLHGLSVRERVALVKKVCYAITHAHQLGVIHRDLKPGNILVDESGEPRIVDFGLAKDVEGARAEQTNTGALLGTLPYAAPEQALGFAADADVRTDIYALGLVLYRTITGSFPYPVHGSAAEILDSITHREPRRLRKALDDDVDPACQLLDGLNEDLEQIARKSLEKSKAHRYQSAAELSADLDRYLAGEAVAARAGNVIYQLSKTLRRFRAYLGVAAVLVLGLGVSLVVSIGALHRATQTAKTARAGLEKASFFEVASVQRDMSTRIKDAIQTYRLALQIGKDLPQTDPLIREQYFNILYSLAEACIADGRLDEARPLVDEAFDLATDWVTKEPTVYNQRLLAFGHFVRAKLHAAEEDWAAALADAQIADRMFADVVPRCENKERVRYDRALALVCKAKYAGKLGLDDEEFSVYTEARRLLQDLHAGNESHPPYILELARVEASLANWYLAKRTPLDDANGLELSTASLNRLRGIDAQTQQDLKSEIEPLEGALRKLKSKFTRRIASQIFVRL